MENTPPSVQVQDIVTFRPSVQDALQDGQPVPEAVLENGTKKTPNCPEGVPPTFAGGDVGGVPPHTAPPT